ncbi:MAG: 2,3-diphosphoglycerate-dependent phosphoglycerate mutase [Planctomycetes bacterium]|nr:2,3-diphosphoglycerate-dependent phosphoglycerate mutase [Planctomycetota bacterium]
MPELVLLRHGQSQWNLENRFTGWYDCDLSEQGRHEARRSGELLKAEGLGCDVAYTSLLKRAIRTLWISLDVLDRMWIPVHRTWLLNERHYGALTGLNKAESVEEHGADQVHQWRRGYEVRPPALNEDDERHPLHDPRYASLGAARTPGTESLADTVARVVPYWESTIAPDVASGKTVIVAAHGNSLRALVMHLDGMDNEAITKLNIPTGFPLVYTLDEGMAVRGSRYLGDPSEIEAAIHGVANQTKK